MDTKKRLRYRIICMVLCTFMLQCTPALAADNMGEGIMRTISPEFPVPGEQVDITISLPPGFFGGVIEELPDGFIFMGTSHPEEGTKQIGRTIIFAVTGEEEITYTVQMPLTGCGIITGEWEDIGTGISGDLPETVLAPEGTDPASYRKSVQQSPGFGITVLIYACLAAALPVCLRRRER
jgi:hypothetical protein